MNNSPIWFAWKGVNQQGDVVQGLQQAPTTHAAKQQLLQQRIRVRYIRRYRDGWQLFPHPHHLKPSDITAFARQLATLLHAGIALQQSLEVITRGQPNAATEALAHHLQLQIHAGSALHQALRQRMEFDAMFCNLVQVGEMMGALDTLLDRIATHREKTEALQAAIRSALVYPAIVLGVTCVVSGLLLSFVVPAFETVFASFEAELPAITRGLLSLSQQWQTHGWQAIGTMGLVMMVCRRWLFRQARWQKWTHRMCLHLPVAGRVIRHACLARWTRTLATLLRAGIPITESLAATSGVTGNLHYALATQHLQGRLLHGQSLASALQHHIHLFQPMLIQMCAIGEASGTLDDMLERCADQYESKVNRLVSQLSVLVEPLLMLLLGAVIGGMVLALYLPMFQMGQVI